MALVVTMRVGETIPIDGGKIKITVEQQKRARARLRIEAPASVSVGKPYESGLTPPKRNQDTEQSNGELSPPRLTA